MPIRIDRFEDADDVGVTTSERIVRFLAANDGLAYTRGEIAEAIDADPETVGTNLTRLKDRGLVRHRAPYWAFTDDETAMETLEARYGDEFVATLPSNDDGASGHGDAATPGDRERSRADYIPPRRGRQHRQAAERFRTRVRDRLGDDVEALYLFGSVSRTAETDRSDVDVLAVVADGAEYAAVDDELLDIAYDVQLEYSIPVEVHAIEARTFDARRDRGEPFVSTVVEEGERLV